MRAALLHSAGSIPEAGEFAAPPVADHQQLVSLVAAGMHPVVKAMASGNHYASGPEAWPRIPGIDAVARTADGRLAYTGFTTAPFGTFAELMAVPRTLPLPEGADEATAVQVAAAMNPGLSSWLPLRSLAQAGPLGTVWVLGATGSAGTLAVQNARELGATRVVAVGRRRSQLERVGADAFAVVGTDDDVATLAAEAAVARPSVVLDFVWGPVAEVTFQALVRSTMDADEVRTTYVEIGQSGGSHASVPAEVLRSSAINITGSGGGSMPVSQVMAELPAYLNRICEGRVRVPVQTFPLAQVGDAWRFAEPGVRAVVQP